MSGFKYTAKIEKEGFKEILIDSGSVATVNVSLSSWGILRGRFASVVQSS